MYDGNHKLIARVTARNSTKGGDTLAANYTVEVDAGNMLKFAQQGLKYFVSLALRQADAKCKTEADLQAALAKITPASVLDALNVAGSGKRVAAPLVKFAFDKKTLADSVTRITALCVQTRIADIGGAHALQTMVAANMPANMLEAVSAILASAFELIEKQNAAHVAANKVWAAYAPLLTAVDVCIQRVAYLVAKNEAARKTLDAGAGFTAFDFELIEGL